MTKMFASALALTIATTGAWADNHTNASPTDSSAMLEDRANLIRTRDITGGDIYTMNEADDEGWSGDMVHPEVGADWNEVGEIEDIILSKDGRMIGVVAEVGGFLDIADKHVVIPVENVNLVAVDDRTYAMVTRHSEEELEQLESVDEGFWD
ncbi:PRC-barrel domain-containing protein [Marivita sp. S0852]|uniref:PRC-barrel domain-containing protein n=1 Tax=Marivita sp. S0852 TaxID=3373893 RepID=UPI0039826255